MTGPNLHIIGSYQLPVVSFCSGQWLLKSLSLLLFDFHFMAISRLHGAQILRLVNTELFNECALWGISFNISVPNTPLGKSISFVTCSCEMLRCPVTRLGMREERRMGSLCGACHLQRSHPISWSRGGLRVNWETNLCYSSSSYRDVLLAG